MTFAVFPPVAIGVFAGITVAAWASFVVMPPAMYYAAKLLIKTGKEIVDLRPAAATDFLELVFTVRWLAVGLCFTAAATLTNVMSEPNALKVLTCLLATATFSVYASRLQRNVMQSLARALRP